MEYKHNNTTIILGDCMNYMQSIPDNAFDLAIVDPPYGIGASRPSKKPTMTKQRNGTYLKCKNTNIYEDKDWDNETPTAEYFDELFRISKEQIIFGINYFTPYYLFPSSGRLVWGKLKGDIDQYGCEIAYLSMTKRTDIVYYKWSGFNQGSYCGRDHKMAQKTIGNKQLNEKRIHPTQKPIMLYDYIFKTYYKRSSVSFKVIDTHLGSGSSAISAHRMGFEFVGIENDEDYFQSAIRRFKDEIEIKSEIF